MSGGSSALALGPGARAARAGVLLYVTLLVALPLLALLGSAFADGLSVFVERVTEPVALSALSLSLSTAAVVALINVVFGTATAWALVRFPFPGRALLSALVGLPLAIPTLVAGLAIAVVYGPSSLLGARLSVMGVEVLFARPGIVLALLFVTLPLVVRAIEPVLAELDPDEEEAAAVLGAGPVRTFLVVSFPILVRPALSGGVRSLGRALGEFGSIVVVAGNIPFDTLTAPIYVFGEIESGAPRAAAAVSVVLLAVALSLHALARFFDRFTRKGDRGADERG